METTGIGGDPDATSPDATSLDDGENVTSLDVAVDGRGVQTDVQTNVGPMTGNDMKPNRDMNRRSGRKGNTSKADVEYGLSRNFLIDQFRKGRVSRRDICDAHPELLRAARNVGKESSMLDCPVCEVSKVSYVTYAFGSGLPSGGRCIVDSREILKVKSRLRSSHLACYLIEVCPSCGWNHLIKIFWV